MSENLGVSEIKRRSIKGAKWLFFMNGFGLPAAFLISLLLGKTSPSVLGTYSLLLIFVSVVKTFVIYGGPPVFNVFLPKINTAEKRGRFFFSYLLIIFLLMIIVLALFKFFPSVFRFLIRRDYSMDQYWFFILLSVSVVFVELLANTASGLMIVKISAIARQMVRLVLLPTIAFLYLTNSNVLVQYGDVIIIVCFVSGYTAGGIVCLVNVLRERRVKFVPKWYLPEGFWGLSASSMGATIFTFLYHNFDKMAVLSLNDLSGLGKYQAVLSISLLITIAPKLIGASLIPMFSSLLATGNKEKISEAYNFLQRNGSMLMTVISLFLISFSTEILSLYGREYAVYDYLLVIFSIQFVITSLYFGNTPLLIASEKNIFKFSISFFQILFQLAGTLLFIKAFGVLAIAFSKAIAAVIAQTTIILYMLFIFEHRYKPPRAYIVGVIAATVLGIVKIYYIENVIGSFCVLFLSLSFFFLIAKIRCHEIRGLINLLIKKKGG